MNPPAGAGTGYGRRRRQTHFLGQFEDFDRGHSVVDRVALGLVHRTIEQSILTVWGALDKFMLTDSARRR